ncbi:MAG: histidine kinase [Xanthomonadales bacterium]|nr:histidine kinase [Xanthomonadales bacterium]
MLQKTLQNPKKLFWLLQTIGWGGFIILNYVQGLAWEMKPDYFLPSLLYGLFGFLLTLLLRPIYRHLWNLPPISIVFAVVAASVIAAGIFDAYKTIVYLWAYPDSKWQPQNWYDYIKALPLSLYVILAWSSLYFAIKSWRSAQQQHEKALRATNAAHQAQLKMLRYQLNPHFLFNTLNAISTLVLDGDTTTANRMITELSAFLRHSLDRNPTQKVSLQVELDNLNRYLSIEKVRFENRLRLHTEIDQQAWKALVPSLILQPLIENAVKFAIAESETGGSISLKAGIEKAGGAESSEVLLLQVIDDGPGLSQGQDINKLQSATATKGGVGLSNTIERLQVLYGENGQLSSRNIEPHGLAVSIRLPLEYQ